MRASSRDSRTAKNLSYFLGIRLEEDLETFQFFSIV